nr:MAG TPA: hypothetical protein [Caudoviricetes sp.]
MVDFKKSSCYSSLISTPNTFMMISVQCFES